MEKNDKKTTVNKAKENKVFENLPLDELASKLDVISAIKNKNSEEKKPQEKEVKIVFKPDSEKVTIGVAKKINDNIVILDNDQEKETATNDINQDLGRFTKKIDLSMVEAPKDEVKTTILKDVNFEKFKNQNKKVKVQRKSIFGDKVNSYLRTKKALGIIWGIELAIMAVIVAVSLVLILSVQPYLQPIGIDGPWNWEINRNCANVGYIFDIIACCVLILPFLFLLTSIFVGINGVYSSKAFHYSVWIIIIISLVFFIIGSLLCAIPLVEQALFVQK